MDIKMKILKKTIIYSSHCLKRLFLLVFLIISSNFLFSQSVDDSTLLESLDTDLMNYYLDNADMQKAEQRWLDYARFGLTAVTAEWEKEVLLLMGNDFDTTALKTDAGQKLGKIVDQRFADWLSSRFFNEGESPSLGALDKEIEELNNLYLWDVQQDGSVKYKTTENYVQEKTLWSDGVKSAITDLMDGWTDKMTTAFADLRSTFSSESLRAKLDNTYDRSFETFKQGYNNRLYRLYQMEQSRFAQLRLYDQYSLQHVSESETASNITNRLIAETQNELNGKLAALTAGLDAAAENAQNGGITDAANWQASFSTLLEQGLAGWDDAEARLLMERVEWEQASSREAAEGEEAWAEAYRELSVKRTEWMTEFRETLDAGNRLWDEENSALEDAIELAVQEINENIANSSESLQGSIDNLVGMMLQSVNMMRAARNSWEYWMDRFDGGESGSFIGSDAEFSGDSMRSLSDNTRTDLTADQKNADAAWNEAQYWIDTFETYQNYAADSQTRLAELYGIVVFDNPSLHTAFENNGLDDGLLDNSVLEDDDAWEAIYLDEFQVELLKAQAYKQYWVKQEEIAIAVYEYAADNSSTKENAEETLANLESAKNSYENALAGYNSLLADLDDTGSLMADKITSMETIQQEIDDYQRQLSDVRDEYNLIMTDLSVNNPQYLAEQFRIYYVKLLAEYGMSGAEDAGPASALEDYLAAAAEYGLEQEISLVSRNIINLISGGENLSFDSDFFNPQTASLNELENRFEATAAVFKENNKALIDAVNNSAEMKSFTDFLENRLMLSTHDYRYGLLLEYFQNYHDVDTDNHDEVLYDIYTAAVDIAAECKLQYELRLAELRLYTTDDFSEWGTQYLGSDDYEALTADAEADTISDIINSVSDDIGIYEHILDLYDNRDPAGSFEISDFRGFNNDAALQKIWNNQRQQYETDAETAEAITELYDSLNSLKTWLSGFESLDSATESIEEVLADRSNPVSSALSAYLDGYHNLSAGTAGDMYAILFSDRIQTDNFEEELISLLKNAANTPCLSQLQYTASYNELISFLADEQLLDRDSGTFYSPEAV
ncbi:MAG TPA: hypothetical protein DCO79_10030, partial [Spirochaeta sp.]|nr:hypothetical protein [Spirochaeta sp.]